MLCKADNSFSISSVVGQGGPGQGGYLSDLGVVPSLTRGCILARHRIPQQKGTF